ncbi:4-alpha-glucanotransferase [Xenorhabdus bovienii]|uniref:4-alpha-glucanotransferase n=1 Tax=Xenorhabdus bovienii TaxID=40576 RepID=UPI0023B30708|nr:4-alpha-glucanotransferase [Xenorhabdus bovienii]MDE9433854.1 4-alpha-glucanotransferase [Xenorhabdus bovienii]MDE9491480.1 4-alpha-glucanotransferase [Xenorhabdus bovienii]MDE9507773.1 4-alpha-glucanotransferase [Xenorhabdus bovienii]MDE9548667.1 4-alpha-glucanotransferase [Xenorhabdus bovienii]
MENKHLDNLATEAGIAAEYINAYGKPQAIPAEIRHRILAAMYTDPPANRPVSDASILTLPVVKVMTQGQTITLPLNSTENYRWQIQTEQGETFQGDCQYQITLPTNLPLGYHTLTLMPVKSISAKEPHSQHPVMQIIVAPERCYEPETLINGEKLWGACIQLYTLRSENNWGIGDFGDLKYMLQELTQRGGAFIGLNPLHAMYPAMPEDASPYSPSSRHWLNIIYIDVNQVEDFTYSVEAQKWWLLPETQLKLQHVRQTELVDYTSVMTLKITALRLAYQQFQTRSATDPLHIAFRQFVTKGGKSLYSQAAYDALHRKLYDEDSAYWGWPVWPEKYREPDSDTVKEFCQSHWQEVEFFLWLQWLADTQLAGCFTESQHNHMPIGIYRDLAVGVAQGGSETWCNRTVYCTKASIGAPPDILGPLGQNWGLPPINPHVLRAQAYQPFIELLRSNMRHCGALRIDHVMSLLRLWWIPQGETADKGVYVHYPVDDLLAILALESQRHHCMVIGEDLGIVPEEIVGKLHDRGVYSYKVFYFERDGHGEFRSPDEYSTQAMATITTHDLPTLRGFWQNKDLMLGESIGLYPDTTLLDGLYDERKRCKQKLLDGLNRHGYLSASLSMTDTPAPMSASINQSIHRYIAHSTSALLGLQPEDWLDMELPVNIPGTSTEYPNWRRKLSITLENMFQDEHINQLLQTVGEYRR